MTRLSAVAFKQSRYQDILNQRSQFQILRRYGYRFSFEQVVCKFNGAVAVDPFTDHRRFFTSQRQWELSYTHGGNPLKSLADGVFSHSAAETWVNHIHTIHTTYNSRTGPALVDISFHRFFKSRPVLGCIYLYKSWKGRYRSVLIQWLDLEPKQVLRTYLGVEQPCSQIHVHSLHIS